LKKLISKQIREYAEKLPLVFEWEDDVVIMQGWELKLTPYGDNMTLEDDSYYSVPMYKMRAVLHEQQMKDAYKKEGVDGVVKYIKSISDKLK